MAQRRHWTCVALVTGLALLGTGCGGGDTGDDTTDQGAEATTAVDDTAGETEDTDDTSDDSGEDSPDDDSSAGSGASVPEGADALAVFDIDGVGSYELALTIPSGVCFISDEALTISGDGPNGEAASIDYTASLDTTSVYLDVPADGVQVGAGDAAISGADPVEVNVSGDRVSGSGVFAALDGSGEYEGTFEFVCG
jgi:hypothetical protein